MLKQIGGWTYRHVYGRIQRKRVDSLDSAYKTLMTITDLRDMIKEIDNEAEHFKEYLRAL